MRMGSASRWRATGFADRPRNTAESGPERCWTSAIGGTTGQKATLGSRSARCTANTDIAAAVLSRTALMRLLRNDPRTGSRLLLAISKRMADRLRETTRKLRTFAQMNKALQEELQVVMNKRTPN